MKSLASYSSHLYNLPNGLRLVHRRVPATAAAIFGLAVGVGSADESSDDAGLAHFVEHTIFKGTAKRSAWHIINRMEAVGGELNAYTTKEATVLYSLFPRGNEARAVELLADLSINSRFPDKELDKERQVVLDEIASYRDTPSEAVYDDFEDLLFAGTPLGHNILGTQRCVNAFDSRRCREFLARYYTAPNMVAFYCGPAGADRVLHLIETYFVSLPPVPVAGISYDVAPPAGAHERTRIRGLHQCHTVMGTVTCGIHGTDRFATTLLANITGGPGMNALLNIELRERRGLVYTVETVTNLFRKAGELTVYFGCDPDDHNLCIDLIADTYRRIAEGNYDERRLAMAKNQFLGQQILALENRENTILADARDTLFRGAPSDRDAAMRAYMAVTPEALAQAAKAMLNPLILSFVP